MAEPENNSPDKKKRRKPRGKRLDDIGTPPVFVENCNFCEGFWPSSVKFYDVLVRDSKLKFRACEYCIKAWDAGPPPDHQYFKVMIGKKIAENIDKFTPQDIKSLLDIPQSDDKCSTGTDASGS